MKLKETEEWKWKKLERKRGEMEKMKKENLGIDIDEETFLGIINYICILPVDKMWINAMKVKQVTLGRLAYKMQ
jgi:hypothetical protein